eukprot:CAMPEP_0170507752 /NCGR_PEP_ID=MMETSP0208-20121228/59990_1 /TAXON_ID=197538 /ORGANISM="Strombidium inclinatum, Strain S3" /LENGTH=46 /DNA_ID= /DNA_START= /DNA_END= /DNA_ORIENTATION=
MELKFSMTNDVIITPKSNMIAPATLSTSETGWKSPKPTVDSEVNTK